MGRGGGGPLKGKAHARPGFGVPHPSQLQAAFEAGLLCLMGWEWLGVHSRAAHARPSYRVPQSGQLQATRAGFEQLLCTQLLTGRCN